MVTGIYLVLNKVHNKTQGCCFSIRKEIDGGGETYFTVLLLYFLTTKGNISNAT